MSLLKEAEQLASELQTDAETVLTAFKTWVQSEWEKFCGEARETRVLPTVPSSEAESQPSPASTEPVQDSSSETTEAA